VTDVTDGMDDIVRDFVLESYEGLEQFERDLIALERDPGSGELLSRIFRTVHTVKGTCGFLPFHRLECVAHAGESLLTSLRRGDVAVDAAVTDALLELGDAIRTLLGSIESTGTEGEEHFDDLVARLQEMQAGGSSGASPTPPTPPTAPAVPTMPTVQATVPAVPTVEPAVPAAPAVEPAVVPAEPRPTPAEPRPTPGEAKIRVDVSLLDSMMNLVGELVLTRNQLAQRAAGVDDNDLRHLSQRLRLITADLQEGVMQARMECIDTVWNKLPRVVRDLAAQLGKSVHLDMDGSGTELDRTILEAIKDPMTHIVRNAVDHGLEHPDRRTAAGKPATGTLSLRAFHQGGLVNIEISDDGAGMDPDELRRTAVARGTLPVREPRGSRTGRRSASSSAPASPPPPRSATSPAAASAWMSSRPTSSGSAVSSMWTASAAREPPSGSRSR
jgi:two-component system chemotaxis sensor kinase CheA